MDHQDKSGSNPFIIKLYVARPIMPPKPYIGQTGPYRNPLFAHFRSHIVQYTLSQIHPKRPKKKNARIYKFIPQIPQNKVSKKNNIYVI